MQTKEERELTALPSEQIYVSVIICTRNRAAQLGEVLDSFCQLMVPPGLRWELIVVDNGSTDRTADVVAGYSARLPVRCLREDRPGISNARNLGVSEARGDYICWTDDDVLLDPRWLAAYVEAFRRHPEAAVFGGRIHPVLAPPTPEWFAKAKDKWPITTVLAARDFGDEVTPVTLEGGRTPYGANFAIRAIEQREQLYNANIGASPTQSRIGEETDVIHRVIRGGGTGWWVPDSEVQHIIQPQRQTLRYIFRYYRITGESFAYLQDRQPDDTYFVAFEDAPTPTIKPGPYLYRQLVLSAFWFAVYHARGNFDSKLRYLRDFGFFYGIFSYWRARGAAKRDQASERKT